jgi:hypothetical protein
MSYEHRKAENSGVLVVPDGETRTRTADTTIFSQPDGLVRQGRKSLQIRHIDG